MRSRSSATIASPFGPLAETDPFLDLLEPNLRVKLQRPRVLSEAERLRAHARPRQFDRSVGTWNA
jgi:hypothetical protein